MLRVIVSSCVLCGVGSGGCVSESGESVVGGGGGGVVLEPVGGGEFGLDGDRGRVYQAPPAQRWQRSGSRLSREPLR